MTPIRPPVAPHRPPSAADVRTGLLGLAGLLLFTLYGVPVAMILWRAAL